MGSKAELDQVMGSRPHLGSRGLHDSRHDSALGSTNDEFGQVVLYALDTLFVGGVTIQPVFGQA